MLSTLCNILATSDSLTSLKRVAINLVSEVVISISSSSHLYNFITEKDVTKLRSFAKRILGK